MFPILFNDFLDDGRAVEVEADDYEAADYSVGLSDCCQFLIARLRSNGFPVGISEREEERFQTIACECVRQAGYSFDD